VRTEDARRQLALRLAAAGVPSPEVDAALLLRHVLGWSAARLRVDGEAPIDPAAEARLEDLARRREAREPLQLLIGSVGFRRLDIEVGPGVFIPRPETEVLAGEAIARVPPGGVVVEPCTGTAAVACAVADESGAGRVVATDIAPAAVALARANAARCGVAVEVLAGDLLAPVPAALRGRVDVLVSNPPYVAAGELAGLEPEVVDWDPPAALVSGPTGHEVTDRLIAAGVEWLAPRGWLLLEVADVRAVQTATRARAAGLVDVAVLRDLAGRDRVVVARRAGHGP
jgi:release factor glutamine methyltransferase